VAAAQCAVAAGSATPLRRLLWRRATWLILGSARPSLVCFDCRREGSLERLSLLVVILPDCGGCW
jgi:hypothetical protein